ncbi:MAG TPA: FMN-binding glutamate synthase family protein [Solirubrobacteraceae bacterium]|jgi:glutamate synthase domain-containing protein 2|nr:FMN-binding glutamate synthase family protein [Solirubrobacteraceae bacterium]
MAPSHHPNAATDENAPVRRNQLGHSRIFTPEVIDDIHVKSELGRYRMRGFSIFKPIPHWDELMFLPGTLTRFVIEGYREKCATKTVLGARFAKKPLELDIPIYITGMSFGALSLEAKMALAKGASMAGTATCSGEGGMIPPERDLSTKWYYQVIQSRYGFNPHHLMLADGIEFFIGQGCKVGLGGHLMGQKVTEQVAEMRSLPVGIDQRSPARHPDWLGPDDLSLKIQEIREATNYEVPIQLKLGAARVYDDVRMAAKCGPDTIYLDGAEGSTGAGPHIATEETGIPLMAAIPEARRALEDVGMADEIDLIVAGGIRNGADVAKCLALGANAVAIGHSALMALNCNKEIPGVTDYEGTVGVPAGQCYHCHTGRCPVGITTQDPELRRRLVVDEAAQRVYNFLHTMTLECQMLARACGKTDVHSLEPEDLAALTVEASAMARVPLAGTDYIPGVSEERTLARIEQLLERHVENPIDYLEPERVAAGPAAGGNGGERP